MEQQSSKMSFLSTTVSPQKNWRNSLRWQIIQGVTRVTKVI